MLHVCENLARLKVDKYEYVTLKVLATMLPGMVISVIVKPFVILLSCVWVAYSVQLTTV